MSNTAGSALWAIDYVLHAATLGIKEAYFHEGIGFKYNFVRVPSPFDCRPVLPERALTTASMLRSNPSP